MQQLYLVLFVFGMQALAAPAAAPGNVLPLGGPKAGGKEGGFGASQTHRW